MHGLATGKWKKHLQGGKPHSVFPLCGSDIFLGTLGNGCAVLFLLGTLSFILLLLKELNVFPLSNVP